MSSFRRSGTFGIVGVFVVAAVVAAIALTMGSGQANPTGALALIFGVVGVFVLLLFVLQAKDLRRAEGASAGAASAPPRSLAGVADPTTLAEPDLWAALATGPITDDARQARQEVWGTVRGSMRLGWVVTPLIFAAVVPVYLLQTFVPLLIGVPIIVGLALWKSVSLLRSGGELEAGYASADRAMAPLELRVVERPTVWFKPRLDRPLFSVDFLGVTVMAGERHGRAVSVCFPGGQLTTPSAVALGVATPDFEVDVRGGRLRAAKGAPEAVGRTLASLPRSKRWNGVRVEGGEQGLMVYRRSSGEGDWLCDLWLAERLATALGV